MNGLIGSTLGGYQILSQIGRGGMATVFKAYQPSLERYVAVKVMPPYYAEQDETFIKRFKREARAIANLRHPNILMVMDHGEHRGMTYIVMEYVEAGTLSELLGQPLAPAQISKIITQVASALHYAHGQGVVHRDIKPSNILLPKPDWPLLTDFGLAKIVGGTQLTQSGTIAGTPAYMSPEQGSGDKIDFRSDIYSLGVVLYEMATGVVPYEAETPMAVVVKHIIDPLPLPRSRYPDLPESIERVLLKALVKDANDRYQSAEAFGEALEQVVEELPVEVAQTQPDWRRTTVIAPEREPGMSADPSLQAAEEGLRSREGLGAVQEPPEAPAAPAVREAEASARAPGLLSKLQLPRAAWIGGAAVIAVAAIGIGAWQLGLFGGAEPGTVAERQLIAAERPPEDEGPGGELNEELIRELEAAVEREPDNMELLNGLAQAQFAAGDHAGARATMQRIQELGWNDPGVQETAAWSYYEWGFFEQAAAAFERYLELEPEELWKYYDLTSVRLEMGDLDGALDAGQRGMEAGAVEDPELLEAIGSLFVDYDHPNEAEPFFTILAERFPDDPRGYARLAEVRYLSGDVWGAIETMEQAARIGQDSPHYESLGWWYWEVDQIPGAEASFQRSIDLDPENATSSYGGLAQLLTEQGQPDRAERLLRDAVGSYPFQPQLHAELGAFLAWHLSRYDDAIISFEQALELEPDQPWRYVELAQAHAARGSQDEAAGLAQQGFEMDPDDPWLAEAAGWVLVDIGRCEAAIPLFEHGLELEGELEGAAEGLRACGR